MQRISHRPYTKGNLFAAQTGKHDVETRISYVQTHTLAGLVRSCPQRDEPTVHDSGGKIFFEARSRLVPGQNLEFLNPDGSVSFHLLDAFEDINGNRLAKAQPNMMIRFCVDFPVFPFQAVRVLNVVRSVRIRSALNSAGQ